MEKKFTPKALGMLGIILAVSLSSCKEEEEKKIDLAQNIPGTWISLKTIDYELQEGSNWKYNEKKSETEGDWLDVPYTFRLDGVYYIEYKEEDDHIIKYKGNYEVEGDTLQIENLDKFPLHNALATFHSATSLSLEYSNVDENGKNVKKEIRFAKTADMSPEKAFGYVDAIQDKSFLCSANDRSYINHFKMQNVTANSVQLKIDGEEGNIVVLTKAAPILVQNPNGYFAVAEDYESEYTYTAIFYFDQSNMKIRTITYLPNVQNGIGETLFWMDE
jgi:hypothetical protein